jgi:hypothetical protein
MKVSDEKAKEVAPKSFVEYCKEMHKLIDEAPIPQHDRWIWHPEKGEWIYIP